MNPTATRARQLALRKHRREVRTWQSLTAILCLIVVYAASRDPHSPPKDGPFLQRVEVVTEGYKDADGVWRSFDNGTPITVKAWKP